MRPTFFFPQQAPSSSQPVLFLVQRVTAAAELHQPNLPLSRVSLPPLSPCSDHCWSLQQHCSAPAAAASFAELLALPLLHVSFTLLSLLTPSLPDRPFDPAYPSGYLASQQTYHLSPVLVRESAGAGNLTGVRERGSVTGSGIQFTALLLRQLAPCACVGDCDCDCFELLTSRTRQALQAKGTARRRRRRIAACISSSGKSRGRRCENRAEMDRRRKIAAAHLARVKCAPQFTWTSLGQECSSEAQRASFPKKMPK